MTVIYDAALEPAGITIAQFSLLRRIEDSGTPSITELGHLVDLDRSTVGRNLRVLDRLGLVELTTGIDDHREAKVTLSPAGQEALRLAKPIWQATQRRLDAALAPFDASGLVAALQAI